MKYITNLLTYLIGGIFILNMNLGKITFKYCLSENDKIACIVRFIKFFIKYITIDSFVNNPLNTVLYIK